jgi:DNA polymerase-1
LNVLIADCETDGFLDTYTRLWTLQLGSADGDDVTVYADQPGYPPLAEGMARMAAADRVVFHNGIKFDLFAINRLYPDALRLEQLFDTLIGVRLLNPEERQNALEDWGERLGILKGRYAGDFQSFTQELVDYAKQDIHVTRALYRMVEPRLRGWGQSVELEHRVAYVIALQEQNGFQLNIAGAIELESELRQEMTVIERELQEIFPPILVADKKKGSAEFTPSRDNATQGYTGGVAFSRVKAQIFNPGSEIQIADRLTRKYHWKPKEFTPTGRPTINETVLSGLRFPECKPLLRYLKVQKQLGQLADGDNAWLKLVKPNGRVYGAVNTIGCSTRRMSHFAPNIAQVDKDPRMRSLWGPRPGWKQVGSDAEGLEARMLGHYLARYDNGVFGDRVINGDKSAGTDVHSVNLAACRPAGLATRDGGKRLLYALMYGAGDAKLGWICKDDCRNTAVPPVEPPRASDAKLGKELRVALAKGIVGIDKLTDAIKMRVKQTATKGRPGYVTTLDGGRIYVRADHSALNFLLQGGGAIVMKMALVIFHFELLRWEYGVDFAYCANVHDEVQIECKPELAEEIGRTFSDAIRIAGERLNVRCPLAGAYDVGDNWGQTH